MAFDTDDIEVSLQQSVDALKNKVAQFRAIDDQLVEEVLQQIELINEDLGAARTTLVKDIAKLTQSLVAREQAAKKAEQEFKEKVAKLDRILQDGVADPKSVAAVKTAVEDLDIKGLTDKLDSLSTSIPDTSGLAKTTDLPNISNLATKADIPNITNLAKKTDIPDTSDLATKTDIPNISNLAEKGDIPDISNLATKTDIPTLATLTTGEDGIAKKADLTALGTTINDSFGAVATRSSITALDNKLTSGTDALAKQSTITALDNKLTSGNEALAKESTVKALAKESTVTELSNKLTSGKDAVATESSVKALSDKLTTGNGAVATQQDVKALSDKLDDLPKAAASGPTAIDIKTELLNGDNALAKKSDILTAASVTTDLKAGEDGVVTKRNIHEHVWNADKLQLLSKTLLRTLCKESEELKAAIALFYASRDMPDEVRQKRIEDGDDSFLQVLLNHARFKDMSDKVDDIHKDDFALLVDAISTGIVKLEMFEDMHALIKTINEVGLGKPPTPSESGQQPLITRLKEEFRSIIREELKNKDWIAGFIKQFLATQSVKDLNTSLVTLNRRLPADLIGDISGLQVLEDIRVVMNSVGGIAQETYKAVEDSLEPREDGTSQTFATAQAFWTTLCQHILSMPSTSSLQTSLDDLIGEKGPIQKIVAAFQEGGSLHKALASVSSRVEELERAPTPIKVLEDFAKTDIILALSKFLKDVPDMRAIADLLAEISKLAVSRDNIRAVIDAISNEATLQKTQGISNVRHILALLEDIASRLVNAAPLEKLITGVGSVQSAVNNVNTELEKLTSEAEGSLKREMQSLAQALSLSEKGNLMARLNALDTAVTSIKEGVDKVSALDMNGLKTTVTNSLKTVVDAANAVKSEVSKILSTDEGGFQKKITDSLDGLAGTSATISKNIGDLTSDDPGSLKKIIDVGIEGLTESLSGVRTQVDEVMIDPQTNRPVKRTFVEVERSMSLMEKEMAQHGEKLRQAPVTLMESGCLHQ
ncbi:hypothetical protein Slin15195_G038060 [Septoria linicola]|uniref:Uncharacterized protein n=1 Tax=Septoria linicola TaxID=215465 RepID=A0A9Q9AR03_9PEZI|nr:hypothetical protein Slin14017_G119460 [Septoria linicola]USW50487.1 hypothetical protein Slin15195_G038060 [Septoria linicola]